MLPNLLNKVNVLFPVEYKRLIEANPQQLELLYDLTKYPLETPVNKFWEDAIRGIRLMKFISSFPSFTMDKQLFDLLQDTKWKICFDRLSQKNKANHQRTGRLSTTLENLFSHKDKISNENKKARFEQIKLLSLMSHWDILEGITSISNVDIQATLAVLESCAHFDACTQNNYFYFYVLMQFCKQIQGKIV